MRSGIVVASLAMVFVAGSAQVATAQQDEPQLQHVAEVHVKPGMQAQFEAGHVARNGRMTDARVTFLNRATTSESLVYRFTTPVGDWAGLGQRASEMAGMAPAAPGGPEAIDHVDTYLRWTRPDLTYIPANPRLEGSEWQFLQRVRLYVRQGKIGELTDLISDAVALYTEHDSPARFNVSQRALGADGPIIEIFFFGSDGADLYTEAAETQGQMGAALDDIRTRAGLLCRRIEITNHDIRRDLAYQPPS